MTTRSLFIVALCVASAVPSDTEPLRPLDQVIKSRSDASSAYANEYTKEYEPIAYAAVPLHNPMPVIAILSEKPIHQYAASYKQPSYAKPYDNDVEIEYQPSKEDSEEEKPYAPPEYKKLYPKHKPYAEYQKPHTEYQNQYPEYKEPHADYPKPYPEQKYANYERPYAEYETQHADYKPYFEYKKPYPKYQKPYVQYPKPVPEYQRPYVMEYPKYAPVEYAKLYPEETRAYAPIDYVNPYPQMEYRPLYDQVKPYATIESPTILYARPSESGGYTYHRRPQKKRNVKRLQKAKPVIIRVHKHRVIRSRRSHPDFGYQRRVLAVY